MATNNLTLQNVAEIVNRSPQTISQWRTGKRLIPTESLIILIAHGIIPPLGKIGAA